jgi:PAS domain S-box-containing protein
MRPFVSTAGLVVALALIVTATLGVLAIRITAESADAEGAALVALCGFLFAILSAGAFVSFREDRRRKETEASLRSSESRMRAVLETAVDAIISIDDHGIVQRMNEAAERMFGYSRSEVIGRNVNILMPSPEREAHDGYLARYRATGERKIIGIGREVLCRRKDGTEFPADLAVGEYFIENQRKFTGFLRDISNRKQAEARIREQAALLDKARDVIFVRDLDDRIIFWNQAAERLYGWSAHEACGKTCRALFFHGDDTQLEVARTAVLNGDEWVGELKRKTRDDRNVVVESRWSLLRDEKNRPKEILSIESDVTEKKERERHSLRAQRLESIGTLAGGVAHDLNNMLTPILMSAKLLKKERPAAERDGLADNILASAERGAEMIKQLLSFTGGVETQRTRVDLRAIVREITSLLEHTLPKSISVRAEIADDLWPVSGDATQLSQVLMNLCVNARDAMPDGGSLAIAGENRLLDGEFLATSPELTAGPHVVLTVTDSGSGIPAAIIDRIFDPFFTTKAQGKGTGLGLSTVLGIVKSHGGTVQVSSNPGRSTTFSVVIPTIETVEVARAQSSMTQLPAAQGKLVLVVDDESFILTAVKATLEEAGYCVDTARDGSEALSAFRRHHGRLNAVLVDMMMPGMDGAATMRALREIDPGVRIVASSGLRTADDVAKAVSDCAVAFLQKPYTDELLLATLSKVLQEGTPA